MYIQHRPMCGRRWSPMTKISVEGTETEKETTKSMEKKSSEGGGVDWFREGGSRRGGWYDIKASSLPPSTLSCLSLSVSSTSRKLFKPPATTNTHTLTHTFLASREKLFRVFTQVLHFSTLLKYNTSTSILFYDLYYTSVTFCFCATAFAKTEQLEEDILLLTSFMIMI